MRHTASATQAWSATRASAGFVAADVAALVQEATMAALRRLVAAGASADGDSDACAVTEEDLRTAAAVVRPSALREARRTSRAHAYKMPVKMSRTRRCGWRYRRRVGTTSAAWMT